MKTISDAFGSIEISESAKWGKNTQRSLENFPIGSEKMPKALIEALVLVKRACARVNGSEGRLTLETSSSIIAACDEILQGDLRQDFPLSVWQTGSGTQTNMNVNEVIAYYSNTHPNDDVNCGQSSNDVFPSAIHLMALKQIEQTLLPVIQTFKESIADLMMNHTETLKTGRTHLQDATPISFGQEASAWLEMMNQAEHQLKESLNYLRKIPIGATAVGTGLNTFEGFDFLVCRELGVEIADNKFHSISSKDALLHAHSVLNTLATNLMKMMNDIRWLSSGPRCGMGEISLPANEAGSSIMPGKVNPTQCESLMMICAQVMGNQTVMSISNMSGNFQLNTFMPVMALNLHQSIHLLSDGMASFNARCLSGIVVNEKQMRHNLETSLMSATYLNSKLGYDLTSTLVNKAHIEGKTIREVVISEGIMSAEDFDVFFKYNDMIRPNSRPLGGDSIESTTGKILNLLKKQDTWIKGKDLSVMLDVSDRTIRSDVERLNLDHPRIIESSTRNGYRIDLSVYGEMVTIEESVLPQTPQERTVYIIKSLLFNDKKLSIQQIEERLFVSENTIESDLKRLRDMIKPYAGLSLVRENKTLSFRGDERIKRKIYRDLLTSELQGNFLNLNRTATLYRKFDLLYVTDVLNSILDDHQYNIRQTAIPMIIVHLGISIERMLNGNYIENLERSEDIINTQEYEIAQLFYERIVKTIPIEYRDSEVKGLSMILLGYKNAYQLEEYVKVKGSEQSIPDLIDDVIELLNTTFDLDFSQDDDFKNGLHLHIQSLVGRIVNKSTIPNVHLQEIKRSFPLIFEMGLSVGKLISNTMGFAVSESESGFLSLHIGAGYERLSIKEKYHVMLIAPSNQSLSKLTKGKITNMFKDRIVITHISEYYIESEVEASNVDLIISTLPIEHALKIPIVQVSMFVSHEDESKIFTELNELDKVRFDIEFKSRFGTLIDERFFYVNHEGESDIEIINYMCDDLLSENIVDEGFKESVLERESMSSTSFIYAFAIPHALELKSKKSKISIALLDKPIRWGSYDVKVVMLLAISAEDSSLMWSFFDWLSEIIDDTEKLSRLIKSKIEMNLFIG